MNTPASELITYGVRVTFGNVALYQAFELNGNVWIKSSTATAAGVWPAILPNRSYIKRGEPCHVKTMDRAAVKWIKHAPKPRGDVYCRGAYVGQVLRLEGSICYYEPVNFDHVNETCFVWAFLDCLNRIYSWKGK